MNEAPEFYAKNRQDWHRWLERNHDKLNGVWLICDKGPNRKLTWPDIVQEALCFGWIDGRAGKVSETQSKIYVSRRKPNSTWSKINKAHVEVLTAAGLMTPAGQAAIDLAKQNGSWDTLNKSDNLELPPELIEQFDRRPVAKEFFDGLPPSARKQILYWIYSAKRDETRLARINKTVELAEQGIRAY